MRPIASTLDHIVIVASALEEGVDFCEKKLGVKLAPGGEHIRVGTHNALLNLGSGVYMEVIAVNPKAAATDCPRWFGMDWPEQRKRAAGGPYLATFVARTNDISHAVTELSQLGPVRDMQRGALEWRITIRDDGALVEGGTLPTVIQWPDGAHPTQKMPASGCSLVRLDVFHPQPTHLREAWRRIGLAEDERLRIASAASSPPGLVAHVATPAGIVTLN
ncbi:VOC family protein [Noviherbaspirillum sp. ST9]|uniref:VOC family protein n=1 Tax=Noviherbaspirillum sp. ST9 TaxID=3401606 RepID=UPI003B586769